VWAGCSLRNCDRKGGRKRTLVEEKINSIFTWCFFIMSHLPDDYDIAAARLARLMAKVSTSSQASLGDRSGGLGYSNDEGFTILPSGTSVDRENFTGTFERD
jgi:hypothetical protein